MQRFWNSWKTEYLAELRKYNNKIQPQRPLIAGDYCLVLTERLTKTCWPVGVVKQVFKGRDGLPRTVEIKMPLQAHEISDLGKPKTQYKTLRRGIESIILLEAVKE